MVDEMKRRRPLQPSWKEQSGYFRIAYGDRKPGVGVIDVEEDET